MGVMHAGYWNEIFQYQLVLNDCFQMNTISSFLCRFSGAALKREVSNALSS